MLLKHFCIIEKPSKCFEYNKKSNLIVEKSIENICTQNYLYEIRDESGKFAIPSGINVMEKGFSQLECEYDVFLTDFIEQANKCKNGFKLNYEDRRLLFDFIAFIVLRNPVVRDISPAIYEQFGVKIQNKIQKGLVWFEEMSTLMRPLSDSLMKGKMTVLRTNRNAPFITSDVPFYYEGSPIYKCFYIPISSCIAIMVNEPENVLIDLNSVRIIDLYGEDVDGCNMNLIGDNSIICCSKEMLIKYHSQGLI